MRVSVQKNEEGNRQVSEIIRKVAEKEKYVTNVANGATCYPIRNYFRN